MDQTLEKLFDVISARKNADADASYAASLFAKGTSKIAQKVGEEAVEAVIEAMRGDKSALARESADLLFHLMILWADQGLTPQDIMKIFAERSGVSGIDEKNNRQE